jgi:hypothetical protein
LVLCLIVERKLYNLQQDHYPTVKNLPAFDRKSTDLRLFCSAIALSFSSFDSFPYRYNSQIVLE